MHYIRVYVHICTYVYYWEGKYLSRRLMVLFISLMEDQIEEVSVFSKIFVS